MLKGTSLKATAAIVLLLCLACTVSHAVREDGSGFYYGIYDGDYTDLEEWPEETVIDA